MIQNKKIYEFNHVRIFFIVIFCSITSFLFYVYMALPRNVTISDYEAIESQSNFDKDEQKHKKVNLWGWFLVREQNSSRQLKKEIVLSNSNASYSYPVQYIDRPDIVELFKDDGYRRAGFACQIDSRFIKTGSYKMYMRYVYDNKNYISDLKKEIKIQ